MLVVELLLALMIAYQLNEKDFPFESRDNIFFSEINNTIIEAIYVDEDKDGLSNTGVVA